MSKKILLFGTVYYSNQEHAHDVLPYWLKCIKLWNPDIIKYAHIALVDSNSPINFQQVFNEAQIEYWRSEQDDLFTYQFKDHYDLEVVSFRTNIGHYVLQGGVDGGGRAQCQGLKMAIDNDMEYVIHLESDMFVKGVKWVDKLLEYMSSNNHVFTAPFCYEHNFLEMGFYAANVKYLRDTGFIEKYGWESTYDMPEKVFQRILGDDYHIMPMRGCRNENAQIHPMRLKEMPYAYITHFKPLKPFYQALGLIDEESPADIFSH